MIEYLFKGSGFVEKNCYEIIHITRCSNQGKIKQEYQWRIDEEIGEYGRIIDKGSIPSIDGIAELNKAFIILSDPYSKKEYDCELNKVPFDGTPYPFDVTDDSTDYSINEYKDMIVWLNNKIQVMQLLNDSLEERVGNIKIRNDVVSTMIGILENLDRIKEEKEKQEPKKKLLIGD